MSPKDYVQSKMPPGKQVDSVSPESCKYFTELTDIDGDGGLDLSDYAVIETLMRIPISEMQIAFRMFDLGEDGTVDAAELDQMIHVLATNNLGAGLVHSEPGEAKSLMRTLKRGKNVDSRICYDDFKLYVMRLRRWILTAMFEQFDRDEDGLCDNEVGPTAFAEIMVIRFAPDELKPKLRERIVSFERTHDTKKLTLADCEDFGTVIRNVSALDRFFTKYMQDTTVTPAEMRAMCRAVLGIEIAPLALAVVYHLFDTDQSGDLSPSEFFDAMKSATEVPEKDQGTMECIAECFR